jgi:hypothetical protein
MGGGILPTVEQRNYFYIKAIPTFRKKTLDRKNPRNILTLFEVKILHTKYAELQKIATKTTRIFFLT